MPGIGLGISFAFNEVPADGSFCSTCKSEIFGDMHKLYISLNTADPLRFELLPSQYQLCKPCKIEAEKKL